MSNTKITKTILETSHPDLSFKQIVKNGKKLIISAQTLKKFRFYYSCDGGVSWKYSKEMQSLPNEELTTMINFQSDFYIGGASGNEGLIYRVYGVCRKK